MGGGDLYGVHIILLSLYDFCLYMSLGLGIVSLLIGLLVRVGFTFVCVLFAGFSIKEKVFIALAWMPKATVQVCLLSKSLNEKHMH